METIIQQIVSEVVEEFLAVVGEKGIESIEQAIEDSRKLDTIPQSFLLDKRRTFAI